MGKCKFLLGLGIGSVLGVMCYHFGRSDKAREWKDKMCCAASKMKCCTSEASDACCDKAKDVPNVAE